MSLKLRLVVTFCAALSFGIRADPLDMWIQRSPIPTANDLTGVVFANGHYLAFGGVGIYLRSDDAASWTTHRLMATNALNYSANAAVYAGGQFVAVGLRGAILTSPDGLNWTPQWSGVDQHLRSVTYGNGRFMAVGGSSSSGQFNARAISTSLDGVHWTVVRLSDESPLWQVAFGENRFVAVGNYGEVVSSRDGREWISYSAPRKDRLSGVVYGNGRFVIVGGGGQILISTNGIGWSTNTLGIQGLFPTITFDGQQFLIAGDGDKVWISNDGISWTPHNTGLLEPPFAVTYAGGQYVAVGGHGFVATSGNGLDWAVHSHGPNGIFEQVAVGNGQILVSVGGMLMGTSDGNIWSRRGSIPNFLTVGLSYANGQFVMFGRDGNKPEQPLVLTSADGFAWTKHEVSSSGAALRIIYGGGQFVGVGGGIFSSPDAVQWTVQPPILNNELHGVAYGNGGYVAVGLSGLAYTSTNGATWNSHSTGTNWLGDVTFGEGKFVAVGSTFEATQLPDGTLDAIGIVKRDAILTSPDGEHWTTQTVPADPDGDNLAVVSIDYGGGWFVAVGERGLILTSRDGIRWQTRDSTTFAHLQSVRYANGTFIAVGQQGTLLTSGNILEAAFDNATAANNSFSFRLKGETGQIYRIEATTNFAAPKWIEIGTVTNTPNGVIFVDSNLPSSPRFYRAARMSPF
jgi:hypothetical protein